MKEQTSPNSCVVTFGPGPSGALCGMCDRLSGVRLEGKEARTLYYCRYSGLPKRVTWPACANFIEPSAISFQPPAAGSPDQLIAES